MQVKVRVLVIQPVDRGPDRQGGSHRPFRVILVGDRCAEQRHHGVADELLDRAPVVLQLLAQQGVVGSESAAHILNVHSLAATREANQVGEQHRHDLALLTLRHLAGRQRGAAGPAEAKAVRVRLVTRGADRHQPSLRPRRKGSLRRTGQVLVETVASSRRYWCTNAMAMLPSPTAAATRLTGL